MPSALGGAVSILHGLLSKRKRLGDLLLEARLIDRDQLANALEHQQRTGQRLGYQLVKLGYIEEKALGGFLAEQFGIPAIDDEAFTLRPELFEGIPKRLLLRGEVFPLSRAGRTMTLAMADPTDRALIDEIAERLELIVNPVVAPQSAIKRHLAHYFALREIGRKLGKGSEFDDLARFITNLKDYRFLKLLGSGGFGMVFKCWQVSLDRPVAIKTLNREISRMPGMVERFRREGKIIARLNHPNIIQVYEQGQSQNLLYITMEYFEGETLDDFCAKKDLVEKISTLLPICDALDYAAQKGIVHRDIKPANILANENGEVKLLDFGIACYDRDKTAASDSSDLTKAHYVLGTPRYMAPECFRGAAEVATPADIYAMGIVIFELLSGKEYSKNRDTPLHRLNPSVPEEMGRIVEKALEPDQTQRLKSFDLFKRALLSARDRLLFMATVPSARLSQRDGAIGDEDDGEAGYEELQTLREDENVRVVLARHRRIQREVIVKEVAPQHVDQEKLTRLSDIQHPNIGRVFSSTMAPGASGDAPRRVIVLEYMDGGSLAERLEAGAVSSPDCAKWFLEMTNALEVARQRGAPHGSLHPGNILFNRQGRLKVVDFWSNVPAHDTRFARYGRPELTNPWQRDRYALGVMWFEMLTGSRYRGAQSFKENFAKVHRNAHIDRSLKAALARLWGVSPTEPPYQNTAEIAEDLQKVNERLNPTRGMDSDLISSATSGTSAPHLPREAGGSLLAGKAGVFWLLGALSLLAALIIATIAYLVFG